MLFDDSPAIITPMNMPPHRIGRAVAAFLPAALFLAPTALCADLDPSGQGGQYQSSIPTQRVAGAGGAFAPSTLWAPLILLNDPATSNPRQSFLTPALVQSLAGQPVGVVATFQTNAANTAADRVVLQLGTTDLASPTTGASAGELIREAGPHANSPATLLPDGRLILAERRDSAQNNLGLFHSLAATPPTGSPPLQAPFKVFSASAVGIADPAESALNPATAFVLGSVITGAPSAAIDPAVAQPTQDSDLLLAVTLESRASGLTSEQVPACPTGVNVFRGLNNDPRAGGQGIVDQGIAFGAPSLVPVASWLRSSLPLPLNPPNESRFDARQTQPVIRAVQTPSGARVLYIAHGIGFVGGSPFKGGAARPLFLAVDTLRPDYAAGATIPENNTILIEADATGPVGTTHGLPLASLAPSPPGFADHWNTDPNLKFVDQNAADTPEQPSGVGNGWSGRFDLNSRGELAALWADESVTPNRFEARLYRPTWNAAGARITGYTFAAILAASDQTDVQGSPLFASDIRSTISPATGIFTEITLPPFSGLALDDAGRVAFVAVTQKFDTTGDWDHITATPPTRYLQNVTTGLFLWEPTTQSLHLILTGGQNGATIPDAFPASGPALNESLALGAFGFADDADALSRGAFSPTAGLIALNFRSAGNQFVAGLNQELERRPDFSPDTFLDRGGALFAPGALGINERSARGALIIRIGAFLPDNACCIGNADKVIPPAVNFADITSVLSNWGADFAPATGPGDADCDGIVSFSDITAVLSNWNAQCP